MTFLLLVVGIFAGSQLSPFFLDINYILRSFTLSFELAIVALVLTMVIIAGEIDLSPAANMALSACVFAWAQASGIPMPLAIAHRPRRGLVDGPAQRLDGDPPAAALDHRHHRHADALSRAGAGDWPATSRSACPSGSSASTRSCSLGIPLPVVLFIVLAIVLGIVLGGTIFGRNIYQIGTNEMAARHAGIRTRPHQVRSCSC